MSGSLFGRKVIDVQTNKSGGAVAYGDVAINDTANDHAFTTTTSAGFTAGAVGVCIEPNGIASNATGRIQYQGYCAQVNAAASVTRGYFLTTHTVAKQATSSSTRVVGSFGVALKTSATPDALLWGLPDASSATGNMATDALWDAAGDLAQGTGANTGAKLSAGTLGQFLMSSGAAAANAWAGRELDYVQYTSPVSVTNTTEGTADTVVTGSAVAYDGATVIMVEFWAFSVRPDLTASNRNLSVWLYDGASSIGRMALFNGPAAVGDNKPCHLFRRLTPSNASHTYSIRASVSAGTGNVGGGAGGSTADMPGFIRITRAV